MTLDQRAHSDHRGAAKAVAVAAASVRLWVHVYTFGMSPKARAERIAEIESDIYEQRQSAGDSYALAL